MCLPLTIIFIGVPLLEIYLFIVIGSEIGALSVISLIVITALIGFVMMKKQGFQIAKVFSQTIANGESPEVAMAESLLLLIGGVLLLIPGFFTDAVGLLCLLAPSRRFFIIKYLLPHLRAKLASRPRYKMSGRVIDIEKD